MIAQEDHPHILEWLSDVSYRGGSFVRLLAAAALVADSENYPLLRPIVWTMFKKYPDYQPGQIAQRDVAAVTSKWEQSHGSLETVQP
jgi:hypothetical protein